MSETEKNPVDMSTDEIRDEIETCYESLNLLSILSGKKMKLGSDVGGGILHRAEILKDELKKRDEH